MKLASHHHRLSFPFIKILHEPHSFAVKKQNTVFASFPSFPGGRCSNISFSFCTQTVFYPPSFLVFFQLIIFQQFFVSKCFCIHDILSKTNQHQSLSLLRLVFLHFVVALSNPSLFVKIFIFLFFLTFGRVFFLE